MQPHKQQGFVKLILICEQKKVKVREKKTQK